MRTMLRVAGCIAAIVVAAMPASAGVRDIRLGVVRHNVLDRHHREPSENIEGEVVFDSPHLLRFLGAPRPYLEASVNDEGYTSFAAAGLYWRKQLSDRWAIEPGFGVAVHDGELNSGGARRVELGTRVLFRETLAIERAFTPHLASQFYFEHLSNGDLLGSDRNQGLNEIGVRMIFRFKPAR